MRELCESDVSDVHGALLQQETPSLHEASTILLAFFDFLMRFGRADELGINTADI